MDLSLYPPGQRVFINRLFSALFSYHPEEYPGEVVVYEAKVAPLLYLPQVGRTWHTVAAQSEIVGVVGTHIGIMHDPYVSALADDLRQRIIKFFARTAK
jgi:thioesterase domain-containing protein